jgi:hypothetical protein
LGELNQILDEPKGLLMGIIVGFGKTKVGFGALEVRIDSMEVRQIILIFART